MLTLALDARTAARCMDAFWANGGYSLSAAKVVALAEAVIAHEAARPTATP